MAGEAGVVVAMVAVETGEEEGVTGAGMEVVLDLMVVDLTVVTGAAVTEGGINMSE